MNRTIENSPIQRENGGFQGGKGLWRMSVAPMLDGLDNLEIAI